MATKKYKVIKDKKQIGLQTLSDEDYLRLKDKPSINDGIVYEELKAKKEPQGAKVDNAK